MRRLTQRCSNVKFYTDLPESSITEAAVGIHKTFLDTLGRTSVTIKARNLVDELRDRRLIISYETSLTETLRKPFIVFASVISLYVAAWAIGTVQVGFAPKK